MGEVVWMALGILTASVALYTSSAMVREEVERGWGVRAVLAAISGLPTALVAAWLFPRGESLGMVLVRGLALTLIGYGALEVVRGLRRWWDRRRASAC